MTEEELRENCEKEVKKILLETVILFNGGVTKHISTHVDKAFVVAHEISKSILTLTEQYYRREHGLIPKATVDSLIESAYENGKYDKEKELKGAGKSIS